MYGEDSAEAKRDRLLGGLASATAAHTVAMASLQTVHSETAHEIQQLKQEDAALKQELAAVASADKKTDVQTARLDEARTADIPRVKCVVASGNYHADIKFIVMNTLVWMPYVSRHSISLYCNISHIRWDTESRNVAGCVMPPDGGVMKPFDIDATKVSEFYVANKLWDLIGDATAVQ